MSACWKVVTAVFAALALDAASGQEAMMEEVVVEAPSDLRLELPNASAVRMMIDRLQLRAQTERALDLQIANRTPLSTLLDLAKYSPVPLGGSDSRVDVFFFQNSMRADLNPRREDPLSLGR